MISNANIDDGPLESSFKADDAVTETVYGNLKLGKGPPVITPINPRKPNKSSAKNAKSVKSSDFQASNTARKMLTDAKIKTASKSIKTFISKLGQEDLKRSLRMMPPVRESDQRLAICLSVIQKGHSPQYDLAIEELSETCTYIFQKRSSYIPPVDMLVQTCTRVLEDPDSDYYIEPMEILNGLVQVYDGIFDYFAQFNTFKRIHNLLKSCDDKNFLNEGFEFVMQLSLIDKELVVREKLITPLFKNASLVATPVQQQFHIFLEKFILELKFGDDGYFSILSQNFEELGDEYKLIKLLVPLRGLIVNYQANKRLFQEAQFNMLIKSFDLYPKLFIQLYSYLLLIVTDTPEKVFNPIDVIQLVHRIYLGKDRLSYEADKFQIVKVMTSELIVYLIPLNNVPNHKRWRRYIEGKSEILRPKRIKNGEQVLGRMFPIVINLFELDNPRLNINCLIISNNIFWGHERNYPATFASEVRNIDVINVLANDLSGDYDCSFKLQPYLNCIEVMVKSKELREEIKNSDLFPSLRAAISKEKERHHLLNDMLSMFAAMKESWLKKIEELEAECGVSNYQISV